MTEYPALTKAMAILCKDQGLPPDNTKLEDVQFEDTTVDPIDLEVVEEALAKLTSAELEILCIGGRMERLAVHRKIGKVHDMVNRTLEYMMQSIGGG